MARGKQYIRPSIFQMMDLDRYAAVETEFSPEQRAAFLDWIEAHYLESEKPEEAVRRFTRSTVYKALLA